jgi:hypothetical protein
MTIAEAIADRLKTLSPVTALVSTRVWLMKVPQNGTFPCIRVQRISESQPMHLRGPVAMYRSRVQVDSYASETSGTDPYATARDIDEAVHGDGAGSGLCGFAGSIGSVGVKAILPVDVREGYDGEEQRLVRIMREYEVHHTGN